ncbi:hypothetical protein Vadar_027666 [Vaccinium darrowii]|uniref:Uncharacterized protein n=1 Tax=Vaccinium darrowii TaxID=229202 RepID=A0ACB7XKD4_9ERIC|nr:hypothetical protein Vadar_027666 [Vaccinium darrowii]
MSPLLISVHLLLTLSLRPPSHSLTCTSQNFTNNKLYSHCLDLPSLSSYLHYTYTPSTSSLSIAFLTPRATSSGWISWAINPTSTGMIGSQAFLAFKANNGFLTVQPYSISSYSSLVMGNLSFEVGEIGAEYSGGLMTIFATFSLPVEWGTKVNQVWQVGPSVTDGFPDKHAFQAANLNSRGTLDLLTGETTSGGAKHPEAKRTGLNILYALFPTTPNCLLPVVPVFVKLAGQDKGTLLSSPSSEEKIRKVDSGPELQTEYDFLPDDIGVSMSDRDACIDRCPY